MRRRRYPSVEPVEWAQLLGALLLVALLVFAGWLEGVYVEREAEGLSAAPSRAGLAEADGPGSLDTSVGAMSAPVEAARVRTPVSPRQTAPKAVTGDSTASDGWRSARVSVYGEGDGLLGNTTANGERLDATSLTFAHRSLAFGTRVTFRYGGREVTAYCNDRGPFVGGRTFDLAPGTRKALGMGITVATVEWRYAK